MGGRNLEVMRVIVRGKSKCVPEYRRELLKSDDIIVEAVHGDNYWSCGLRTHETKKTGQEKNIMGQLHDELRRELQQ